MEPKSKQEKCRLAEAKLYQYSIFGPRLNGSLLLVSPLIVLQDRGIPFFTLKVGGMFRVSF